MKTKTNIEMKPLFSAIVFFFLGLILYVDFNAVINFVSYVLGTIIIGLGIYNLINYYRKKSNNLPIDYNEFGFGLVDIILGVLIIVLADVFITILRFFVGGWVLLAGINRFVQAISFEEKDSKFAALLVMSLIIIAGGVYIILNKDSLNFIGLIMMIYAIIEIIVCIFYRKASEFNMPDEVIEAEVVETQKNTKNKNKKNK